MYMHLLTKLHNKFSSGINFLVYSDSYWRAKNSYCLALEKN